MHRGIVAILAAVVGAAAATLSAQSRSLLIVAYMTSDGELVPVARYNGATWTNTWPDPIPDDAPLPVRTAGEIPRSWLGQPVPLTWTAWVPATGKQQRVTVTGVDRDGACVGAITLATSFKPNVRFEGLAFDRPMPVDAIVRLEQTSPEHDVLRREVALHFRSAIDKGVSPQPKRDPGDMGTKVLARARLDSSGTVILYSVFKHPRLPMYFIEAERHFSGIPTDTDYDALSYGGWFRRDGAGALTPIDASLVAFSTADEKLPRYTPIGIFRRGGRSIWAMSEWGKESHTIVLFDVSADAVRKLTSALIGGC